MESAERREREEGKQAPPHKPGVLESFASLEKTLPFAECVVVAGRGIERVTDSHGQERWRPTRYIQELLATDSGYTRTGKRKPGEAGEVEDQSNEQRKLFVAGGTANTLAGIQALDEYRAKGAMPKLFILAAGRPAYLSDEPEGFSEGTVMKEIFERRASDLPETIVQDEDKNTKDSVVNALSAAHKKGLSQIVFINTEIAMPRTQEFYRSILQDFPEFAGMQVRFVTSEDLLRRRFARHPERSKEFEQIQQALVRSGAWKTAQEMEEGGIQALRDGKYRGRGDY